jgi:predicted Zn-dependent protease
VLEKQATDPRTLLKKAEAHIKLGQLEDARKALDRGLAATKSDPAGQGAFQATRTEIEAAEKQARARQDSLFKKMVQMGVGD